MSKSTSNNMNKINENFEMINRNIIEERINELEDDDNNEEIYKWLSISVALLWILSFVIF
jgi:uncharacterized protein YbcC (UPF0753/DUF2309 family)